jgi:hypothetical protein
MRGSPCKYQRNESPAMEDSRQLFSESGSIRTLHFLEEMSEGFHKL